ATGVVHSSRHAWCTRSYSPFMTSFVFFFSSRRRHTRWPRDWSSDVCSSDLVAPVGEAPADALVGDRIAGLESVERLVGEHHAEAEGVVGPVALVERDLPARPGFLREEREVQAAGPAADDADFHAASSGITAVASISRRAASSTRPLTCTTAIVG